MVLTPFFKDMNVTCRLCMIWFKLQYIVQIAKTLDGKQPFVLATWKVFQLLPQERVSHTRFQIGNLCIIPPWMLHNSGKEMCLTRENSFINSGIFQKKTYQTSLQAADVGFKKAGGWLPWLEFISSFWRPSSNWIYTNLRRDFFGARPVMHGVLETQPKDMSMWRFLHVEILTFWMAQNEVLVETRN